MTTPTESPSHGSGGEKTRRKYGRRHENHYVLDQEPDAEPEDEPYFVLCTPANRLPNCQVCEAKTLKGLERRWQVEHDHWKQWVVIDTRREARWIVEDDAYDCSYEYPKRSYRITPLWMVAAEVERMPEWNP